jgi:hypothetical protein
MIDGKPHIRAHRNGPIPPDWDCDPIIQRVPDEPKSDPYRGWDDVKKLNCVVKAYDDLKAAAKEFKITEAQVQFLVDEFEAGRLS